MLNADKAYFEQKYKDEQEFVAFFKYKMSGKEMLESGWFSTLKDQKTAVLDRFPNGIGIKGAEIQITVPSALNGGIGKTMIEITPKAISGGEEVDIEWVELKRGIDYDLDFIWSLLKKANWR